MHEDLQENISIQKRMISNSRAADSGGKVIFENPDLCSQLLRDYTDLELLKNIRPEDIEDVTERFIPMFTEQRDADVVKKVHLSSDQDFFVALIEHKSGVDYNVVMQILRYMVYIWEVYEKQQEKDYYGISNTKKFKYPPILPIVYYEGEAEWTADKNLASRITLNEPFKEFIPNFSYYLISLNKFSKNELINKKSSLAFVMLINRIKNAKEFTELDLPKEYVDRMLADSSNSVLEVIAKVIAVVLRKQNVPENDIQEMVDQVKRRKSMALFDGWKGFDVQEERRNGEEIKLIKQVCSKLQKGWDVPKIAELFEEDEKYIEQIYGIALRMAPDYDADNIYRELIKIRKEAENKELVTEP